MVGRAEDGLTIDDDPVTAAGPAAPAQVRGMAPGTTVAGAVTPDVGWGGTAADNAATGRVRAAARLFPASWVTAANETP